MDSNYIEQVIESIANSIKAYFDMEKNNLPHDKTIEGRIKSISDNNTYTILVQGAEYNSVPCCSDIVYTISETVWITLPQGNWDNMFIIGRRNN